MTGRGGGIRTHDHGFGDRCLRPLGYTPGMSSRISCAGSARASIALRPMGGGVIARTPAAHHCVSARRGRVLPGPVPAISSGPRRRRNGGGPVNRGPSRGRANALVPVHRTR